MKSDIPLNTQLTELESNVLQGKVFTGLRKYYHLITVQAQIVLDFCTVFLSNALAYWLYLSLNLGKHHVNPELYWTLNILTSLGAVLIFSTNGVYRETVGMVNIEETRRLIRGVLHTSVAVVVGSYFVREYSFSRITCILAIPVNLLCLYLQRGCFAYVQGILHRKGLGVKRCLIYGTHETGIAISRRFVQNIQLGWVPVGFLCDDDRRVGKSFRVTPGPSGRQLTVLGVWDNLQTLAQMYHVSDVVVVITTEKEDQQLTQRTTLLCKQFGLHCHFVYAHPHHFWNIYELRNLDGIPLFSPRETQFGAYDIVKRSLDVIVSSLLLILLSPAWLLITLIIKYDSTGPVLFRQMRIGRGGQEFTIYKLRTMYTDSSSYALTASSSNDPRITRVGRFLRRSSLDELPQLLNILKGDMSLVGPRPEMPYIVATYSDYQRQRLAIRPGITGLWQISEDRAFQIHENIEYDLYYIANRSLSLDVAILFQTCFSVVRGIGAW